MNIQLKVFLFLILFSIFHFGYDITHFAFLKPFCGINESVFQHLKMVFWAYLLASVIEYFIVREKKLTGTGSFWFPRLFITVQLPWFVVVIWYLAPSVFGRFTSVAIDVIWAIVSSYVSALLELIVERDLEKNQFHFSL